MIKWEKIKKLFFPEEIQTNRPELNFRGEIRAVSAGNIQDYEQQVNALLETGGYKLAAEMWYAVLIRTRWEGK